MQSAQARVAGLGTSDLAASAADVSADQATCGAPSGTSADYFVPWHVPFHRAGQHLSAAQDARASSAAGTQHEAAAESPARKTNETGASCTQRTTLHNGKSSRAVGQVNSEKRSVMFKRYYHLFEEGELDDLVLQMGGVHISSSKHDASNWVVVFERTGTCL